jgi:hypothetical protein
VQVAGVLAPTYRRAYGAEHDRREQLEQALSQAFPGLSVKEMAVSDFARLEDEVALRFSLSVPRLAERDDGGLRFLPFGAGHRYVERLAPLSARRFDLVLGDPWTARLAYRYALPPGFVAVDLPPPTRLDSPFASFEASCRQEGGLVVAEARIAVRRGRVEVADYPAFRELLSRIDRALGRPVRVAPSTSSILGER